MKFGLTNRRGSPRAYHASRLHPLGRLHISYPPHYGHHEDHGRGRVHRGRGHRCRGYHCHRLPKNVVG